jgi:hypothetical protein
MPFPADAAVYHAMYSQADVISSALESLAVQIDWSNARVDGMADVDFVNIEPLFTAFSKYAGVRGAMQAFTREIVCLGNVSVFAQPDRVWLWSPEWRDKPDAAEYHAVIASGQLFEAKRPPIIDGYGTPVIEPALSPFKSYWAIFNAQISALDAFTAKPSGPIPHGSTQIGMMRDAVLQAAGFEPWTRDIPIFREPARLRAELADLFQQDLLTPFASHRGVQGNPRLVLG